MVIKGKNDLNQTSWQCDVEDFSKELKQPLEIIFLKIYLMWENVALKLHFIQLHFFFKNNK